MCGLWSLFFSMCVVIIIIIILDSTPYKSDLIIFLLQNNVCLL